MTIKNSTNGCVSINPKCQTVNLEFGNFFLKFKPEAFTKFKSFIQEMNVEKFEKSELNKNKNRKILVSLSGVTLAFHKEEIDELKSLLNRAELSLKIKQIVKLSQFSQN
ncbi:MAG: hypothetical protein DWQ06_10505 [Calditrichaeota bacterium]|nr:MAG: hypothetical protein DWQ06_10505 [Calditrichota bacterium]